MKIIVLRVIKSDCQDTVSTEFKHYNKTLYLQPFGCRFVSLKYSFVLTFKNKIMLLDGILDLASDLVRMATDEEKQLAQQFDIVLDVNDFVEMDEEIKNDVFTIL
jgi:hypothetical protein